MAQTKNTRVLYIVIPLITFAIAFVVFSYFSKTFIFAEEPRTNTTNYTYPMDEIVVNLKDDARYIKAMVALGYNLNSDQDAIKQKEVQIRDAIISILRSKSVDEIKPIENTKNLKNEIQNEVNEFFAENIVTDIYLTDFIIQ